MGRSGYVDDMEDQWALIRYRGAVKSAMRGKRGQVFFKDLLAALDALPEKKLIARELEQDGQVCALGALGKARGVDMTNIDPYNIERCAGVFGIADCLAREVVWENDEVGYRNETPERRYERVRSWVQSCIMTQTD